MKDDELLVNINVVCVDLVLSSATMLESVVVLVFGNNATLSLLDLCCTVVNPKFVVVVVVVISIAVASVIVVAPSVVFSVVIVSRDLVIISEDPNCVVDPKTLAVVPTLIVDLVVVLTHCVVDFVETVLFITDNNVALYNPPLLHMVSPAILGFPRSGLFDKSHQLVNTLLS